MTNEEFPVHGVTHKKGAVITVSGVVGKRIVAAGAGKDVDGRVKATLEPLRGMAF